MVRYAVLVIGLVLLATELGSALDPVQMPVQTRTQVQGWVMRLRSWCYWSSIVSMLCKGRWRRRRGSTGCSGSGGGRGDWDCNERGDGRSLCADVLPLRRFLARRIAAAGRDGNRPSSASAGWVPDALDLADVLLVLQAHT